MRAVLGKDSCWVSDNSRIGWDVAGNDRVCPDPGPVANRDITQELSAHPDHDTVADSRMALDLFQRRAAERDLVIHEDIIADNSSLADNHPCPMVDKEPASNCRAWVDFNSRQEARPPREDT